MTTVSTLTMKIIRADEHLKALNDEVTAFLQIRPYEVVTQQDVPARRISAHLVYRHAPPDRLVSSLEMCSIISGRHSITWPEDSPGREPAKEPSSRFCKESGFVNRLSATQKDEAELMTYFVERGNKFTVEFGDIGEGFYDALLRMYQRAIKKVLSLPGEEQHEFRERLRTIMVTSDGIGWGYHDGLCQQYCEGFPEEK